MSAGGHQRTCLRCEAELPNEGAPYCGNCAAPQLRCLEDDVLAGAEHEAAQQAAHVVGGTNWTAAVTACLTSAGAIGLLSSLLVVPLNVYFMVWSLVGAGLAVTLYESRTHAGTLSGALGARLGLLTGILSGAAMMVFSALFLVLQRFAFGNGWRIDRFLATWIEQMVLTTPKETQSQLTAMLAVPDWRAGLALMYAAVVVVLMAGFATLGGAMGGKFFALRRRFQQINR